MQSIHLAWLAFGLYVGLTSVLAFLGMRRTKTLAGFALGNGDLGPITTGITLAAAIASTATFVINPGFVYTHGLSALMHLGVASAAGLLCGLVVLSRGFRRLGQQERALTLPHWIGARYGHRPMRTYFAVLNLLLSVSFVVLIVKGSALVMQQTLGLSYVPSVLVIVGFVFSYIMLGGTYAHVYTNVLQGVLMAGVAVLILWSGAHLFGDGFGAFFDRVAAQDPNLVAAVNPASPLFDSYWGVYACGFVVGFALIAQPHILTKSLYLKNDRDLRRYLIVGAAVVLLYTAVLIAGLYARLLLPGITAQDTVMPLYLAQAFSTTAGVLVSISLLSAGMSTLDGILVSASTIAANDVLLGALGDRLLKGKGDAQKQELALKASRWVLVVMGLGSLVLALNPPRLVGLFAQTGIYGLVAASTAPIVLGIYFPGVKARDVFAGAVAGPLVHFGHVAIATWWLGQTLNPAIAATSGILTSFALIGVLTLARRLRSGAALPAALTLNGDRS